jgi:phytoene/squalene synthetase
MMAFNRKQALEILESIDFVQIKKHPNILIAAGFWEKERYRAAQVCYKYMRTLDDLIDDHKMEHILISPDERPGFQRNVDQWLQMLGHSTGNGSGNNELVEVVKTFQIPLPVMEDFAKAMIYDINSNCFPTMSVFLDYAQGASVAPASIFVHLGGLTRENGGYKAPPFNVKAVASPCALFSYLVHIIRDFQKDQLSNLCYFADDLIQKHNLSGSRLRSIAEGSPINNDFRNLMAEYYNLADGYRLQTIEVLNEIKPLLEPRYRLSLEMIFSLYLMVFERIDPERGTFTTEELNPSPAEIKTRVKESIMQFEF